MITIGYGDVVAVNEIEMLVAIILMIIACGLFGFTLNSLNGLLHSLESYSSEHR